MVLLHPDPLSAVSSSINATIKILEVTYQLKAVDEQTADLLTTTRHVDFMVQEARRLRRLKAGLLNTSERTMIDTVISDTEDALRAVAKLVEPCRVDKSTRNSIRFGHRVMWVFRDNPSVRDKHQKLQVCHQSLTIVFNCLYSKDVVVLAPAPEGRSEEEPPPYDPQLKELLDWQNRRRGRKSLGEREGPLDESLGLMKDSSDTSAASPSIPCLLAIPLENVGGTSGTSNPTETYSDSPAIPTLELPASLPCRNDKFLNPATASPGSSNTSPSISTQEFFSDSGIGSTLPAPTNRRNDYFSSIHDLPRIDSPPFATMIAAHTFNKHEEGISQVDREHLAQKSPLSTRNQKAASSAIAPSTIASDTSPSPMLTFSTVTFPISSELGAGCDLDSRTLELSQYSSYTSQVSAEASNLGQHPLVVQTNSDIKPGTFYQSDRSNTVPGGEDITTRENRVVSVGQGIAKRGGRSWLAYHATRSDTGHSMDWNG